MPEMDRNIDTNVLFGSFADRSQLVTKDGA